MSAQLRRGYSALQIGLHWSIAGLVIFQLVIGESMTVTMDAADSGADVDPLDLSFAGAHYWVGSAILALVLLRLVLRLSRGVPQPGGGNTGAALAAGAMHALFYLLLIVVPLSGLLAFYQGDPWGDLHGLAKPVFIVLIALHALAALIHQFWFKDGTLQRMLVRERV